MWWSDYIGLKFSEKGRDRNGVDCWGLVRLIYDEKFGIALPDYSDLYSNTTDDESIQALVDDKHNQHWMDVDKPISGDIIFIKMNGMPTHVGIVTSEGYMLHCLKGIGAAQEPYNGMKWRNKVVGFARWKT